MFKTACQAEVGFFFIQSRDKEQIFLKYRFASCLVTALADVVKNKTALSLVPADEFVSQFCIGGGKTKALQSYDLLHDQ